MNVNLDKLITKDLNEQIKKTKRNRVLSICLLPLGFIMFASGVVLMTVVGIYFVFLPIVGAICLFISAPIMTKSLIKEKNLVGLKGIVDLISTQDKIFIYQIGGNEAQNIQIISKLIEIGTLENYKIVKNIAVVNTDKFVSEDDIMREYMMLRFGKTNETMQNENDEEVKECYYCHAKLPLSAVYCTQCGAKQPK